MMTLPSESEELMSNYIYERYGKLNNEYNKLYHENQTLKQEIFDRDKGKCRYWRIIPNDTYDQCETIKIQCLNCKNEILLEHKPNKNGYRFCPYCRVEFKSEFTKKNQRWNIRSKKITIYELQYALQEYSYGFPFGNLHCEVKDDEKWRTYLTLWEGHHLCKQFGNLSKTILSYIKYFSRTHGRNNIRIKVIRLDNFYYYA